MFSSSVTLTINLDGKLLEDISRSKTIDRIFIIDSGKGIDQLLVCPKLQKTTGEALYDNHALE